MNNYLSIALLGYLLGTPNPSLMLSRVKGVDVTEEGTGNPGASNTALLLGVPLGLLVAFLDISKAVVAVQLCKRLFRTARYAGVAGGIFCVLGHMFPFYRRFRGGKGFASYAGLILALDWRFIAYFLIPIALIMLLTDYVVFGNLSTMVLFPMYGMAQLGVVTGLLLCALSIVMLCKHRENLAGIARGDEMHIRHRERSAFRLKK